MVSKNKDNFTFPFQSVCLIFFSFFLPLFFFFLTLSHRLIWNLNTMLSRSGESSYPCFFPDVMGKVSCLLFISCMMDGWIDRWIAIFHTVKVFFYYVSGFYRVFLFFVLFTNGCWSLTNSFPKVIEIRGFLFCSVTFVFEC